MSQQEVNRAQVLDLLKAAQISQQEASRRLGIGTRQVRRLAKRYLAQGLSGLVGKKRGRASNRRIDDAMRVWRARFGELIQIDGSPHDWVKQLAI